jgi:hypothetical protein
MIVSFEGLFVFKGLIKSGLSKDNKKDFCEMRLKGI